MKFWGDFTVFSPRLLRGFFAYIFSGLLINMQLCTQKRRSSPNKHGVICIIFIDEIKFLLWKFSSKGFRSEGQKMFGN